MNEFAVVVTLTVKVAFPLLVSVTFAGFVLQVALVGALPQLKLTAPAKPLLDAALIWYVAVFARLSPSAWSQTYWTS